MSERDWIRSLRNEGVLRPLDEHLARTLGRLAGENNPLALLGAAAASRAHGAGHICLRLDAFSKQVRDESMRSPSEIVWPDVSEWCAALSRSPLTRAVNEDRVTPLILEGMRVYLDRYWGYQNRLAQQVMMRLDSEMNIDEEALSLGLEALFPPNPALAGEDLQKKAAATAARRGFSIITGGPGTGKTTTIQRLLVVLIQEAWSRGKKTPRFALMAPTGKAAARMKESIQARNPKYPIEASDVVLEALPKEATTIHRALGFNPRKRTQFRRNTDNPLEADIVIVDEASMVDLALMTKLFEAVPMGARLILLGDADQLASVEAGAVLGDLCRELNKGVVKLTHTYRFGQDSGVGALSRAIKENRPDDALGALKQRFSEREDGRMYEELRWIPLTSHLGFMALQAQVEQEIRNIVLAEMQGFHAAVKAGQLAKALEALDAFRVLCAHRKGALGVNGLNQSIERWLSDAGRITLDTPEYIGRPLLIRQNDREQDLYNGDIGFIAGDEEYGRVAIFPSSGDTPYRRVPLGRLPAYQTVYAMTVHKSQGSQLTHAMVVVPMEASALVTRELLYTGVTRAAQRVTMMGSEKTLRAGIAQEINRSSGLAEALARASTRD